MPIRPRRTGRKGAPAPRYARDRPSRLLPTPAATVRTGRPWRRRCREGGRRQGGASGLTSRRKDTTRTGREKRDRVERKGKRKDAGGFLPAAARVGHHHHEEK